MTDPTSDPAQFAYALNGQPCTREAFYAIACDPQRNVVVQACAGAGKTWMLVSRILRALLNSQTSGQNSAQTSTLAQGYGDATSAKPLAPQEILAITFTKKAAGEMRQRLSQWLVQFAHADAATLSNELLARGVNPEIALQPYSVLHQQLSNLYPAVLESGRSVQIRTFHSWFGALLRSAPLAVLEQLGLPAQYELLEDDSEAVALVWRRFYAALQEGDALRSTYTEAVAAHGMFNVNKALASALDKRVEFTLADAAGSVASSIRPFAQVYTEFVGLETPLDLFAPGKPQRQQLIDTAAALGRYDGKIPQKSAAEINRALADNNLPAALKALVTLDGTARKFSDKIPGIMQVRSLQDQCIRINAAQQHHTAWQHQIRMAQLTRMLVGCYSALKRERAWVDMGDVERAALHLLSDPVLSGWVLERLDAQTRHLLIDEFQDTNPLQWQALQAWLSGYAGAGSKAPSVFIVGDPKQSIYRFRRAEPQVFIAATQFVCEALDGVVLSCDHTRRNARNVLAAVNGVMQSAADEGYEGFRLHTTESKLPGHVLRLPLVQGGVSGVGGADPEDEPQDDPDAWRDTLTTPREEAQEHIRTLECAQAARWVAQHIAGNALVPGVPAGTIMVLARKRDRLQRMAKALQTLGIASQITEKTQLFAHCVVQDVVALVDALVSPTHDLSLARALKSPLWGCTDDQLMCIASLARAGRCSWWDVLCRPAADWSEDDIDVDVVAARADSARAIANAGLAYIAPQLVSYQALFATLPPHDALAALYQHGDVIARFMAAAPAAQHTAVAAQLQALLAASLDVDGGRFLTPYAWVRALKAGHVRTPAASTAGPSSVQLLTVHGAKGLEAHTVLMLDADAAAEKSRSMDVLVDWPAQQRAPTTFAFLASESKPPECVASALQREQVARAREETNALYVAMTRAQHTLVLSAHAVKKPDPHSPWQRFEVLSQMADSALVRTLQPDDVPAPSAQDGADARGSKSDTASCSNHQFDIKIINFPDVDINKFAINTIVNSVSTASTASTAPFARLDAQLNVQPNALTNSDALASAGPQVADSLAARVGQCMHRLLELYYVGLDLAPVACSVGAQFQLDAAQSQQALRTALRITTGDGAWVWDSAQVDWQANEVELLHAASDNAASPMAVLRLDRLVKHTLSQTWWVLDYKSAAAPERQIALRQQLTQYQQAVQAAHPGALVRAAFMTGEGQLVEL